MADSKISALAAVTTVAAADEYAVARAGASNKITGANLKAQLMRSRNLQSWVSGVISESFPRVQVNTNSNVPSTGRLSSTAIPVLNGDVISAVTFVTATTAFSGPSNSWFALCDSSLNVIRQSTDQLTATIAANTLQTLTVDQVPVTAGARSASTTVTLTLPTLSQALSALFAVNDSIVVSNANIAAYNGTFTVASVSSTQITYVCGGSATDSLAAPFPTVQPASGKRTYTVPADAIVNAVIMMKGTVATLACFTGLGSTSTLATATGLITQSSSGNTSLTGTCPSPITTGTGTGGIIIYAAVS